MYMCLLYVCMRVYIMCVFILHNESTNNIIDVVGWAGYLFMGRRVISGKGRQSVLSRQTDLIAHG